MKVYRISPINYSSEIPSVLLRKDDNGNCYLFSISIWIEISDDEYNTVLKNANEDKEHYELTQIK